MSICSLPITNTLHSLKKNVIFRITEPVTIYYEIGKNKLYEIIENIISKSCGIKIYGYNTKEEFFWCKQITNYRCLLFINISIYSYNLNKSIVIINPIIGKEHDINCFIEKFTNTMKLYEKSAFIRDYLVDSSGNDIYYTF